MKSKSKGVAFSPSRRCYPASVQVRSGGVSGEINNSADTQAALTLTPKGEAYKLGVKSRGTSKTRAKKVKLEMTDRSESRSGACQERAKLDSGKKRKERKETRKFNTIPVLNRHDAIRRNYRISHDAKIFGSHGELTEEDDPRPKYIKDFRIKREILETSLETSNPMLLLYFNEDDIEALLKNKETRTLLNVIYNTEEDGVRLLEKPALTGDERDTAKIAVINQRLRDAFVHILPRIPFIQPNRYEVLYEDEEEEKKEDKVDVPAPNVGQAVINPLLDMTVEPNDILQPATDIIPDQVVNPIVDPALLLEVPAAMPPVPLPPQMPIVPPLPVMVARPPAFPAPQVVVPPRARPREAQQQAQAQNDDVSQSSDEDSEGEAQFPFALPIPDEFELPHIFDPEDGDADVRPYFFGGDTIYINVPDELWLARIDPRNCFQISDYRLRARVPFLDIDDNHLDFLVWLCQNHDNTRGNLKIVAFDMPWRPMPTLYHDWIEMISEVPVVRVFWETISKADFQSLNATIDHRGYMIKTNALHSEERERYEGSWCDEYFSFHPSRYNRPRPYQFVYESGALNCLEYTVNAIHVQDKENYAGSIPVLQFWHRPYYSESSWWNSINFVQFFFSDQMCTASNNKTRFLVDTSVYADVFALVNKTQLTGTWITTVQKEVADRIRRKYVMYSNSTFFMPGLEEGDTFITQLTGDLTLILIHDLHKKQIERASYVLGGATAAVWLNDFMSSFGSKEYKLTYYFLRIIGLITLLAGCALALYKTFIYFGVSKDLEAPHGRFLQEASPQDGLSWLFVAITLGLLLTAQWFWQNKRAGVDLAERYSRGMKSGTFEPGKVETASLSRPLMVTALIAENLDREIPEGDLKPHTVRSKDNVDMSLMPVVQEQWSKITGLTSTMSRVGKSPLNQSIMKFRTFMAPNQRVVVSAANWWPLCQNVSQILPPKNHVLFGEIVVEERDIVDFINEHPEPKRSIYQSAYERLLKGDRLRSTELSVKTDEFLHIEKNPRPIFAFDPMRVVKFGPYVSKATKKLKSFWGADFNMRSDILINNHRFIPVFAPSLSFVELGSVVDTLLQYPEDFLAPIVSGDDTIAMFRDKGILYQIETDYSKYDQSQTSNYGLINPSTVRRQRIWTMRDINQRADTLSDHGIISGSLAHSIYALLDLGVPLEICHEMFLAYHEPFHCTLRDGKIRYRDTFEFGEIDCFPTGSSNTTFNNSVNNIGFWRYFLAHYDQRLGSLEDVIRTLALELGFNIKVKVYDDISKVTFLKGRFMRSEYTLGGRDHIGYLWTPDPCVSVKFGNSKTRPVELYKHLSEADASRMYLQAVATGWSYYPQPPILRAFIKKYSSRTVTPLFPGFKPGVEAEFVFVRFLDESFFFDWYESSKREFDELESMILKAPEFHLINHPLITRLEIPYR